MTRSFSKLIVRELIVNNKLQDLQLLLTSNKESSHLPYVSLYREKSAFEYLKKRSLDFLSPGETLFSVIFYGPREGYEDSVLENPNFFSKEAEDEQSQLDYEIGSEIFNNRQKYQDRIKKELESQGILENSDSYGSKLDEAYALLRDKLAPKCLKKIMEEETYYTLIDEGLSEDAEDEVVDAAIKDKLKNKQYKKELKQRVTAIRKNYHYEPKFSSILGSVGNYIGTGYGGSQTFFKKKKDGEIQYVCTSSAGSGTRENKGFYSHLFALLSKKNNIPTFVIKVESDFSFYVYKSETLVVDDRDLTGNFNIQREQSNKILEGIKKISSFDDLKWRYFTQSKIKYNPKESKK